jgi:hypothetical protein
MGHCTRTAPAARLGSPQESGVAGRPTCDRGTPDRIGRQRGDQERATEGSENGLRARNDGQDADCGALSIQTGLASKSSRAIET